MTSYKASKLFARGPSTSRRATFSTCNTLHNGKLCVYFRLEVRSRYGLGTDRKDDFGFDAQTSSSEYVCLMFIVAIDIYSLSSTNMMNVLHNQRNHPHFRTQHEAKSFDSRTRSFRSICDIGGYRCCCKGFLYFARNEFQISEVDPTTPSSSRLLVMAMSNISPELPKVLSCTCVVGGKNSPFTVWKT
jgi:hypothetical protein